jgi:hypothetical protein
MMAMMTQQFMGVCTAVDHAPQFSKRYVLVVVSCDLLVTMALLGAGVQTSF